MPSPSPLPMRVLVKGSSAVSWISWMGGPRTDFIYSRVIEEQLLADGRPCIVNTVTMPSERASKLLNTWQQEVLGFSPDVIVLGAYGHFEAVHLFLPRWLERHANSEMARPRRWSMLYRKTILRPTWMALAHLQAWVDARVNPNIRRSMPRHVAADLERYISKVQKVGSPLVILLEFPPPSSRYSSWFPGMAARVAVMNETIADLVTRIDKPNVRFFRVNELIDKFHDGDLDAALPDGFHYTPEMHRLIGTLLAEQIEEWADTQPHLAVKD